jgi:hypothetical protein
MRDILKLLQKEIRLKFIQVSECGLEAKALVFDELYTNIAITFQVTKLDNTYKVSIFWDDSDHVTFRPSALNWEFHKVKQMYVHKYILGEQFSFLEDAFTLHNNMYYSIFSEISDVVQKLKEIINRAKAESIFLVP